MLGEANSEVEGPMSAFQDAATPRRYSMRRRKRVESSVGASDKLEIFFEAATQCQKIVVFSGSGLSATTGVSMFSTKGGLYEKGRKRLKVQDGKRLFTYPFYAKNKDAVQAFFADIFNEVLRAEPAPSHQSLAALHKCGLLQRHYTLNIDGLAGVVGMDTWHDQAKPSAPTVEMHGNIRQLVCPECCHVVSLDKVLARQLSLKRLRQCPKCPDGILRFKIMLYDDEEGDCVTESEKLWSLLEKDLEVADMVLWVGISFEQSASVEYFRKVRAMLLAQQRVDSVRQVLINPSDSVLWNLLSATSNLANVEVLNVTAECDAVLPELAARVGLIQKSKKKMKLMETGEMGDSSQGRSS
ncbi:hypothetical protein BSKO_03525 [Bryopsis sp. KO-2023]|nr:hypothetical protein BSKO_03525 [Bryopsis sp. KO-2023]